MTSDNLLNEILLFNSLNKSERINFICSRLLKIGCGYELQNFESSFGPGTNIVVFQMSVRSMPVIILTSHFDGQSLYDNNCGVLTLLRIIEKIYEKTQNRNYVIVFTDQEETYQQGVYYFLKNNSELEIEMNINVDGFGIGENIYTTDYIPINKSVMTILTDSECFKNAKIKSISIFSSFQAEIEKSKKEDVHSVFNNYSDNTFYINNFDIDNFNKLFSILWEQICSPRQ